MTGFQHAFAQALFAPDDAIDAEVRELVAQPAFAVYRNTVVKGCVDALEANFPAVARLTGTEWFRAAAADYVRAEPPRDGRMLVYGDSGFAAFLQQLPTTQELPYLAPVAQLDTLWRTVHAAADAPGLDPSALAGIDPQELATRVLRPHPATRWAWFDGMPVATIWMRQREASDDDEEIAWRGEGLLLTRCDGAVQWQRLPHAGCGFLDACAGGCTLGEAAERAMDSAAAHALDSRLRGNDGEKTIDVGELLRTLLAAGAFSAFTGDLP